MKQDELRRDSLSHLLKLAFSKEWGLLIGADAQVVNCLDHAATQLGFGSFNLVLRHAFLNADGSAFAVELANKIGNAKENIGSGKNHFGLNGIYSC